MAESRSLSLPQGDNFKFGSMLALLSGIPLLPSLRKLSGIQLSCKIQKIVGCVCSGGAVSITKLVHTLINKIKSGLFQGIEKRVWGFFNDEAVDVKQQTDL